jgi:hypothetical protein
MYIVNQGCQMEYYKTKKSQFGYILEGLRKENVCNIYGNLACVMAIWYYCGYLVYTYFPRLCRFIVSKKSGNPDVNIAELKGKQRLWPIF